MFQNIKLIKIIKIASVIILPALHLAFFLTLVYQTKIALSVNPKIVIGILIGCFLLLPYIISKLIFKSFRSRLEFNLISYIISASISIAFIQINTRTDVVTSIPFLDQYGIGINWSSQLALLMLTIITFGIFWDLLFGKFISEFRLSFTSAFVLQLILSLGFLSYIHLISVSDFTQRYYKTVWLELLVSAPYWLMTLVFATISSLITIFYFGRGNVLNKPRPFWAKISWRLLIILIHFELLAMIMLLPQNYWWKVLFYILIWDFITVPLSRVYKQSTEHFFDRLKISLIYHLVLFIVVFWLSRR